jgi:hypothetical protein
MRPAKRPVLYGWLCAGIDKPHPLKIRVAQVMDLAATADSKQLLDQFAFFFRTLCESRHHRIMIAIIMIADN